MASNPIGAKVGDTVIFTLPNIIDLFSSIIRLKKPDFNIHIIKVIDKYPIESISTLE